MMQSFAKNIRQTESVAELGAYSKVILFGEHSVVFGHPALALGLEGGITVQRLDAQRKGIHLVVEPWGLDVTERSPGQVGEALRTLLQDLPGGSSGMDLELHASVPPGAGLGSSASLSVALVRCLAVVRQGTMSDEQVRNKAHALEKIFHGHPSGLDDTVATYGGLCLFDKKGLDDSSVPGSVRLSTQCLRLASDIPGLVVGDTGVKRSTAAMVDSVRMQYEANEARVAKLFSDVDSCLHEGMDALQRSDWPALGAAMSSNHELLCQLDLSCPETQQMLGIAMNSGALGGKLTGAGGGGAVVVLAPGAERSVAAAWRDAGFFAWAVNSMQDHGKET